MTEAFYPFDFTAALECAEAIEIFLTDAFETQDLEHIAAALAIAARSEGMSELSLRTGFSREQISLSFSTPDCLKSEITLALLKAMDLNLPLPAHGFG